MTKQLSDCCKAEIELTGLDRPNAFKCEKCWRIIGTEITRPVNESWEEEFDKRYKDYYIQFIDEDCDQEDIKKEFKEFFRTLLSTARQEAVRESKEELLRWITKTATKSAMAGVYGYDFVHRLEEKLKHEIFDSLTSKGGTNGV